MKDSAPHWYDAITPTEPDSSGSSVVGGKWVTIASGQLLHFDVILKANGDFVISCKQSDQAAHHLQYRECTIYASQALAMPSVVIWSIILEGVKHFD